MNDFYNYSTATSGITAFTRARASEVRTQFLGISEAFDKLQERIGLSPKGDPGGNIMSVGSFQQMRVTNAPIIPLGAATFYTSEWYTGSRKGGARYVRNDAKVTLTYYTANPWTTIRAFDEFGVLHGYELDASQFLTAWMFGADGSVPLTDSLFTTAIITGPDNLAQFNAMKTFGARAKADDPSTFLSGLRIYLGTGGFYVSDDLIWDGSTCIIGNSSGTAGHNINSFLKFAQGKGLIIPTYHNNPSGKSGENALWEGVDFIGSMGGSVDRTKHVVSIRVACTFRLCGAHNASGNGWEVFGRTNVAPSDPNFGIADGVRLDGCWSRDTNIGLHVAGNDANANWFNGFQCKWARTMAIHDESSLGSQYVAPQCNDFGVYRGIGTAWYVGFNWLATHSKPTVGIAPPDNPDHWLKYEAAAAPSERYQAYDPGKQYECGQPIVIEQVGNRSHLDGGYTEGFFTCLHNSGATSTGGQRACTPGSASMYAAIGGQGTGVLSDGGFGGAKQIPGQPYQLSKIAAQQANGRFYHQWVEHADGGRFLMEYDAGIFWLLQNGVGGGYAPTFGWATQANAAGLPNGAFLTGIQGRGNRSNAAHKPRWTDVGPPANGTWPVGAIVDNSAPASGDYIGWACTVAGTPGTWKGFGLIAA